MSQMSPMVLKDRAPTPVNHAFNPRDVTGGVATFAESNGVPLGERRITASQVRTQGGRVKVTFKLAIPVVQDATVNGVTRPTVVRTSYADVSFNFDASSSTQERADIAGFVEGLVAKTNTMMNSYIVDLEGLW